MAIYIKPLIYNYGRIAYLYIGGGGVFIDYIFINIYPQKTWDIGPTLVYCWTTVYDVGPTANQSWPSVSCLMKQYGLQGVERRHGAVLVMDQRLWCWPDFDAALCRRSVIKPVIQFLFKLGSGHRIPYAWAAIDPCGRHCKYNKIAINWRKDTSAIGSVH